MYKNIFRGGEVSNMKYDISGWRGGSGRVRMGGGWETEKILDIVYLKFFANP